MSTKTRLRTVCDHHPWMSTASNTASGSSLGLQPSPTVPRAPPGAPHRYAALLRPARRALARHRRRAAGVASVVAGGALPSAAAGPVSHVQPVGRTRKKGKAQADRPTRRYHNLKNCWNNLKREWRATGLLFRGRVKSKNF